MVKRSTGLALSLLAVVLTFSTVVSAEEKMAPPAKHAAHAAATPVVWPAGELKWADAPGGNGVKIAVLWGDPDKGAFGAIHKFPAGFKAGLHTHTADLKCIVISGTMIHGDANGKETRLPPGSYMTNPHTDKHTTACDAASECEMFVEANRAFDLKMVGEKAPAKK